MARAEKLWDWLGEPLAVDFANTVRRSGWHYRELLEGGADVASWSARQGGRVPVLTAGTAQARLAEVRVHQRIRHIATYFESSPIVV